MPERESFFQIARLPKATSGRSNATTPERMAIIATPATTPQQGP